MCSRVTHSSNIINMNNKWRCILLNVQPLIISAAEIKENTLLPTNIHNTAKYTLSFYVY